VNLRIFDHLALIANGVLFTKLLKMSQVFMLLGWVCMSTNQFMSNKSDFLPAKVHIHVSSSGALKMLRDSQGLSQYELANLTGISQPNLSALEIRK